MSNRHDRSRHATPARVNVRAPPQTLRRAAAKVDPLAPAPFNAAPRMERAQCEEPEARLLPLLIIGGCGCRRRAQRRLCILYGRIGARVPLRTQPVSAALRAALPAYIFIISSVRPVGIACYACHGHASPTPAGLRAHRKPVWKPSAAYWKKSSRGGNARLVRLACGLV